MASARRNDNGLTARQEAYIALRIDGVAPADAYVRAFKSGQVANMRTVAESARRLEKLSKVAIAISAGRERRARLAAETERRVIEQASTELASEIVLSRKFVLDQLLDNAMKACAAVPVLDARGKPIGKYVANFAASNRALELLGKEIGMFREPKEVDLFENLSPRQVRELKAALDDWAKSEREAEATATGASAHPAKPPTH